MTGNVVKIGVLNDQSSLYTDLAGQGSVVAAQMAVEDFGGKVGEHADGNRLRRSPEQGRYRFQRWPRQWLTSTAST